MRVNMKIARVALTLALVVAVASCEVSGWDRTLGGKKKPAADGEVLPKAGLCLGDQVQEVVGIVPDLTTKVDCSKRHLYEVTGVVKVPSKFLEGESRDEMLRNREELGDSSILSTDGGPFQRFMDRTCSQAALTVSGLGDLRIDRRSGVEALAEPAIRSAYTEWSVTTEKQWLDGHRLGFCVLHFDESQELEGGDDDAFASPDTTPLVERMLDPDLPDAKRSCMNYDKNYVATTVSCDQVHDVEKFMNYELESALGPKFAKRINVDDLSDKHWEAMLKPCEDAMPQIVGPHDPDVFADFLYDGWIWDEGRYIVECVITTDEAHRLPARSLIRDARRVRLALATPSNDA
jgi:hypothetical protein